MYCFESDIHKNLASGAGDEDKEAAELSADFSRRVDSSNNQQTNDLPDFRSFVSLDNKLTDAKSTATVAAESSGFELKRLNTARSRAELNQSQASTAHKSSYSSLPVFSTWTKLKQESSSPPTKSLTWQELSSQINRFAEENMRNAGGRICGLQILRSHKKRWMWLYPISQPKVLMLFAKQKWCFKTAWSLNRNSKRGIRRWG